MTAVGSWRNSSSVVLTGLDVDKKAELFERAVRARFDGDRGVADLRFTRLGIAAVDPDEQMTGSCLLEIAVDGEESSCGRPFSSALVELALANFPGIYYTGVPGNGAPFGVYWPTLVAQSDVDHVVVHPDGARESIAAPELSDRSKLAVPSVPSVRSVRSDTGDTDGFADEPMLKIPLGWIADARSGDKGGNANVGVWVESDETWEWLRDALSTTRLKELLPEADGLDVERYELANLRALNFVIRGLMDGGATETGRFDKQAKALGEWLRSRLVQVPASLAESVRPQD
jgi:hypothetical protein